MFDVQEAFRAPLNVLYYSGMWQSSNSSWTYRIFGLLLHLYASDLFTLFHVFYFFKFESIEELADSMSTGATKLAEAIKTLNAGFKITKILALVASLEKLIELSECEANLKHKKLHKIVGQGRTAYRIFAITSVGACAMASAVPILNFGQRLLTYRMYFPYVDKSNPYVFFLIWFYQAAPVLYCVFDITCDVLPVLFMCFAIGLIEELCDHLENIGKTTIALKNRELAMTSADHENNFKELLKCIEIHKEIKKFVLDIQDLFSVVTMIQGFLSSMIFCTIAFMLSLVSTDADIGVFIRYLTYIIPMLIEIFLPCFYANKISFASTKLSTSLFHSNWENSDEKFKMAMKVFMENTKKPIEFTALGLFKVNMNTFTSIFNFAYSSYALLTRLNK